MPLAPLPGRFVVETVSLRVVVRALPTGPVIVAVAVNLSSRLRASVRASFAGTLTLIVREALAASVSLPFAIVRLPCLRASLPLRAKAYGFVALTDTTRFAALAVPAIVTFGPPERISA